MNLTRPPSPRPLAFAALVAGCVAAAVGFGPPAAAQPKLDGKTPEKKDLPQTNQEKALEAFNQGKVDEALKHLQAAKVESNGVLSPKVVLSRWLREARRGPQARVMLEQAIMEDQSHPDVYLTNASYALAEGRVTDAILSCQQALKANEVPRFSPDVKLGFERDARTGLAAAYEQRGVWTDARQELEKVLQLQPAAPNVPAHQMLARVLFNLGDPAGAEKELRTAFANSKEDKNIDPPELSMAALWARKGLTTTGEKERGEELVANQAKTDEWFKKAVAAYDPAKPTTPKARALKVAQAYAGWLLDRGRADDAAAQLAAADRAEPGNDDTKLLSGLLARYKKDYAKAVQVFSELHIKYPQNAAATASLALVQAELPTKEDKARALDTAKSYVQLNQENPDAYAVYAYCLIKAENFEAADQALGQAIKGGQLSPDTAYYLALVFNHKKKYQEARNILDGVLKSPGGFVFRKDAEALLAAVRPEAEKLDKEKPPEPKKG